MNPPIGTRAPGGQVYGPPNKGDSPALRDSERVGTAPNGEALYAAAWYREPSDDELRGYLSTASGPGWGLIACRTAPDYRVEDCVGLDEYPNGSQINRAVLAAAWQFKVRPPRVGGKSLVGSWVRIRIDYNRGLALTAPKAGQTRIGSISSCPSRLRSVLRLIPSLRAASS
ncbi:hypothetical protein [Sphingopyxis sp. PET50]|uniref:hypothetical protein n=1 Tax=Sphingopyxis sp. PET50 TaxID=2976533 RepID=UPI0021AF4FAE|nr:hypothetical protein [Sphingopyxis sp. PET50]